MDHWTLMGAGTASLGAECKAGEVIGYFEAGEVTEVEIELPNDDGYKSYRKKRYELSGCLNFFVLGSIFGAFISQLNW